MHRFSSDSSTGSDTLPTRLQDNTAASSFLAVGGSSASQQRPGLHASGTEHGIGTVSTETSLIGQPQREAAHASFPHQLQRYSHGNGAVNRGSGALTGGNGIASGGSGAAVGGRGTPNGDRPRPVPLQSQQAATAGSGWRCHGLQGPWSTPIKGDRLQGSPGYQAADTTASSRSSELDLGIAGTWNWAEELSVSGWMAIQPRPAVHPLSWGATLSSYPDGTDAWALSLRRCAGDAALGTSRNTQMQYTAELSLQRAVADGVTLTSGLVYIRSPMRSTVALCCRSQLSF